MDKVIDITTKPRAKRRATAGAATKDTVHSAQATVSPWRGRVANAFALIAYASSATAGVYAAALVAALVLPTSAFLAMVIYLIGVVIAIVASIDAALTVHRFVAGTGYDAVVSATKSIARRFNETRAWIFTPRRMKHA